MFCKNCGHNIENENATCPNCGYTEEYGPKFCHHCGAKLAPAQPYCGTCGVMIAGPPKQEPVEAQADVVPVESKPNTPPKKEPKSKLAAGLFGILFGAFGVHNFYLGHTGRALAQLLITLLTCGFGAIVTYAWGLIEGILILTGSIKEDGDGKPLKD